MKKWIMYSLSIALSLVICGLVLFFSPLWQQPCVNVYSLFAAAFFVMNTIGLFALISGHVFWKKPYTKERPAIEDRKQLITAVVLSFFEVPLLLTVFFVSDGWKMAACSGLLLFSWILGGLIGDASANKLRKQFHDMEQKELAEQLQKEEGL